MQECPSLASAAGYRLPALLLSAHPWMATPSQLPTPTAGYHRRSAYLPLRSSIPRIYSHRWLPCPSSAATGREREMARGTQRILHRR
ncbi:hypothetical protein EJ03DRAFT_324837, partial [Teratosphaeria nubilosa]